METLIAQAQAYVQSTLSHRYHTIQVWRFKHAHPAFQALSPGSFGLGEDRWVVYVPPTMTGEYIDWVESPDEETPTPDRFDLGDDFGVIFITRV